MTQYIVSINGEFTDAASARVSVLDHGFLFGDSIYEVVRTVNGKLFAADRHLKRLHGSAAGIAMPLQRDDAWILQHWRDMHARQKSGESYLRMIVTRGVGELDLHPASCAQQNYFGIAKPLPVWPHDAYEKGCKIILAHVRRNSRESTDPAIKSGNYLNNVLALVEARKQGAVEAVMMNVHGFLTECTTSNIFAVKDGVVFTPALDQGLLEGVTRGFILDVCRKLGIECRAEQLPPEALLGADEAFITSTTRDVMPVGEIGHIRLKAPGSITRRIAAEYHKVLHDPVNHL